MGLPAPEPGLVVSYAYLWHRQHAVGWGTGEKARPAVIVMAIEPRPDVMVAPVTTQPVAGPSVAIPPRVATGLGLDQGRPSRVVVSEVNMFRWPNDLERLPESGPARFHYGFIPPRLFNQIRDAVIEQHKVGQLMKVRRS